MPLARLRAGLSAHAPLLLLAALLCGCQRTPAPTPAPPAPAPDAAAARIRADVRVLSDDAMQGRETGTPGFDRAADAVVARMRAIGLQPAGDDGGYAQAVPLLRATSRADGAR